MLTFLPDRAAAAAAPFDVLAATGDTAALVVCDHASALIPSPYGDLGLGPAERASHVAWDIGAAEVAVGLARHLGCGAVLAGASRLVIDCNRQPGDPSSIPAVTCGVRVPGNAAIDQAEADRRAERWFWPYHTRIGTELGHLWRRGPAPALIGIHSFTPAIAGQPPRPWQVGVLWNRDGRLAHPALAALRAQGGLVVGDNQPYSGREINYTLDTHAGAAGLPNISFEIRHDELTDAAGCERWAALLAGVLGPLLGDPALHRAEVF